MKKVKLPLVSAIHHYALDDGPGIRSTVFLKGCPLACPWCHNPEAISPEPEISFQAEKCIACGDCIKVCRFAALNMTGVERINRTKCNACGDCVDVCPTLALQRMGKYYAPHLLVDELLRDRIFYKTSRGGVTFSGGEPTLHLEYLSEVMKLLKECDIHIAMQTAGFFNMSEFKDKLLPYLDLIFYDIKFLDSGEHKQWTGKDNKIILSNFLELTKQTKGLIIPRIPLIPGITASRNNLIQIAGFIRAAGYDRYELLAYNSAGLSKRLPLGKSVPDEVKFLHWEEKYYEQCRGILAGCFADRRAADGRYQRSHSVL